jgi:GTPase
MSIWTTLIVSFSDDNIVLKPEEEDTNIEYKLRLDTKSIFGLKKLKSQMNWRLDIGKELTGKKEAHYVLGINDNGTLGVSIEDIEKTYLIFQNVVNDIDANIIHTEKKHFGKFCIIYAIVQKIEKRKIKEITVAFVGPSQHGKTTTISKIVNGQNDDGNGYSRKLIFRHEHEKITGMTSSITKEIIGLKNNNLVNYSIGIHTSWENIVYMSDTTVCIIDMPGNLKYIRTILFGLCAYKLDALVIIVDTYKHYDIEIVNFYKMCAQLLNIPYIVASILPTDISITLINNNNNSILLNNIHNISNVTGYGIEKIIDFFNKISLDNQIVTFLDVSHNIFSIVETYFVPDAGIILSGNMICGQLSLEQHVYLINGTKCFPSTIKSIHKKQMSSQTLYTNETGAIQLDIDPSLISEINKHMLISTKKYVPYEKLLFKLISSTLATIPLRTNVQSLLFIENNVVSVVIKMSEKKDIYELYHDPILIVGFNINKTHILSFIKNIDGHYMGIIFTE